MKIGPVFRDMLTNTFTDIRSLRWHLILLVSGPVFLLFSWSRRELDFYLAQGKGPATLVVAAVASGLFLYCSAGGFSMGNMAQEAPHLFVHWRKFTPVGPWSYLNCRIFFDLVHSTLLCLFFLPVLTAAGAASFCSPWRIPAVTGYLLFTTFTLRSAAEAGVRHDRAADPLGYLIYLLLLGAYLVVSTLKFPDWSSINALKMLCGAEGGYSPSILVKTTAVHLLFGTGGYGISIHRLFRTVRLLRAS